MRLAQVILNLVNNAFAYGEPSGAVTISGDGTDEEAVTLSVHNEGPPVPPSSFRLFDAFTRGRAQGSGMGLGLYIRHVAQAHGGDVDVESTGERATFRVRLPRSVGA